MLARLGRTAAGLALCATAGVLFESVGAGLVPAHWLGLALFVSPAQAQTYAPGVSSTGSSPAPIPMQIAGAVEAAPEPLRATATVLGWQDGKTTVIREGTGDLICVADEPGDARFQTACYQKTLEPFMARGRELRGDKHTRAQVDSIRLAEVKAKKWSMPAAPASLYNLAAPADSVDLATGLPRGARRWYVVYIPNATEASSGLSIAPDGTGRPWLMYPGMPWAHIMITPK